MTLEEAARGATYPWLSMDAMAEEIRRMGYPVITGAELEKCMSCKAPECYNCLGGGSAESVGRPGKQYVLDEQIALFPCVNARGHEYEVLANETESSTNHI